jgi:hypothetical protein
MIEGRYTRHTLQADADRWVEKLNAKGYRFRGTPITVYTNGRQFEAAVGLPRGFTTEVRFAPLRRPADGFDPDEEAVNDWLYNSEFVVLGWPSHEKRSGLPAVYVRRRFGEEYAAPMSPTYTVLHQLLHLVTPHLPDWKAHLLTDEIYTNPEQLSATEREGIIRGAPSRDHLYRLDAAVRQMEWLAQRAVHHQRAFNESTYTATNSPWKTQNRGKFIRPYNELWK